MAATVEDAGEGIGLAGNHRVRPVARAQVDVSCQLHVAARIASCQEFGIPCKFSSSADIVEAFAISSDIIGIPRSANSTPAVNISMRRNG